MLGSPEQHRWHCSGCDPEISPDDPGDTGAEDPDLRIADRIKRYERNCDGGGNPHFRVTWDASLRRCPKAELNGEIWELYGWWRDWKTFGCLPFGGRDLNEQPALVYEVLTLCEWEVARISAEEKKGG
jgi:hypothetical protein